MTFALRAIALLFFLLSASCAGTRIDFRGERLLSRLRGELGDARVRTAVKMEVDPAPRLIVGTGEEIAIEILDEAEAPNSRFYVVVDREDLKAPSRLTDGQFIPYLEVRAPIDDQYGEAHAFVAVCRGGRGTVRLDTVTREAVSGHVEVAVSCRTYVDGYEREESTLELKGPFFAERS